MKFCAPDSNLQAAKSIFLPKNQTSPPTSEPAEQLDCQSRPLALEIADAWGDDDTTLVPLVIATCGYCGESNEEGKCDECGYDHLPSDRRRVVLVSFGPRGHVDIESRRPWDSRPSGARLHDERSPRTHRHAKERP